jgi:Mg2+ and Co2+ transporter CorA
MDNNKSINRMTMWNIMLMIPTIIVGYYGMNTWLPFAEYRGTAIMVFLATIILLAGYWFYILWKKQ